MKNWGIIGVILLSLVLVGASACNPLGDAGTVEQQVKVERGDLMVTVTGSGNVGVSNEKRLGFGSGGKIDRIYVEEGDRVSRGDLLAELDTSALELALIQAELARDQADYNLNQLRDVAHASADRIKLAESSLLAAERAVAEVQKQLDEAGITAPLDGVVAKVYYKEGDTVSPTTMAPQVVLYIIDLSVMELSAEVDEIDIPDVKPGQRAIIEVDALPDIRFEGKVVSISSLPQFEAGLVVYPVKIVLDVPEGSGVKAGMSATADIVIASKSNVLLLPTRAIKEDSAGNPIVNVLVGEQTEERRVVTGISDGLQIEIVSGLEAGETIIIETKVTPPAGGLF